MTGVMKMALTIIETRWSLTSIDANDNQMVLEFKVTKDQAFAPEVTEDAVAQALYQRMQQAFPNNVITASRVRTVSETDLI